MIVHKVNVVMVIIREEIMPIIRTVKVVSHVVINPVVTVLHLTKSIRMAKHVNNAITVVIVSAMKAVMEHNNNQGASQEETGNQDKKAAVADVVDILIIMITERNEEAAENEVFVVFLKIVVENGNLIVNLALIRLVLSQ